MKVVPHLHSTEDLRFCNVRTYLSIVTPVANISCEKIFFVSQQTLFWSFSKRVKVLNSRLRGSTPLSLFYPFGREGSGTNLGLVPDEVTVPRCFGTGSTPSPQFLPLRPRREWGKSKIGSRCGHQPRMLWNGEYPLTPIFTPSTAKEWVKSRIGSR